MTTFETFTYKGKEHKFRVGGTAPKIKPLVKYGSDYYKSKSRSLDWIVWLTLLPPIVLGIIYFAYIDSDDPSAALEWFPILAFLYAVVVYRVFDKVSDTGKVLSELQSHAEGEEYLEAYKAWIGSRQDDSLDS